MRAFTAFTLITLLLLAGAGTWYWQRDTIIDLLSLEDSIIEPLLVDFGEVGQVFTPGPLKGSLQQTGGQLATTGVLRETNRHREINDLPSLRQSDILDRAAQKKVDDMFARQYFAHEAPDGAGPADLVTSVGYHYIRVGENLALGNFASDAELVEAWMDSPGHRANILHQGFSEIGLAVGRGTFEGSNVWLAVQEFAAPLSSCPTVDPALQKKFDDLKAGLDTQGSDLTSQQTSLTTLQQQLETLAQKIKELADAASQKIAEGNQQIAEGNRIYESTGDRNQAQPYWDRGEALQAEGQALVTQAKESQAEYDALFATYETKLSTFNRQAVSQRSQNESIQSIVTQLNQQIRAFNACIR